MLRKLILLCVFCFLAHPVFATEADFEKRMARGVAALEADNPSLAQKEFRAAVAEHPSDPEALLSLAIALNRANDPSAESALKTALRLDPGNVRINLELGAFYYNQKMYDEAGDYFENLLELKPDSEIKTAAERYLANIRSQSGGKRWRATVTGGVQYDSNVPLAADWGQLPVGISRRGDMRGVFNFGLTGIAFRDNLQELTGTYSLYQTLHLQLSDFNLTQNLFDVTYKRHLSPLISVKVSGNFESILLGGKQFVNDYSISPGVAATPGDRTSISLDYRFRDSYFTNSATFPASTDRDGVTHSVMLGYRQPLSEALNLRLGYTFDRDVAKVSAWSSVSHLGSAGLAVTLPHSLLLDFSFDAATKKYDEILTGATDTRLDTTFTGAVSLTWQQSEYLCISLGYHYTDNASNIPDYEYTRSITSIMVQGRY